MMLRLALAFAFVTMLLAAGCAPRPPATVLAVAPDFRTYRGTVDLFVASNRDVANFKALSTFSTFSTGRSELTGYEHLEISIPPKHVVGNIEWPTTGPVDAGTDFMTASRDALARQQFLQQIDASARRNNGKILVFVHGFNTLYQEAVYRTAQIVHDSGYDGTPVLFSWPSRGDVTLYLADRESVNYSRNAFEAFLIELGHLPNVRAIDVLAHSMGTLLVMETLEVLTFKGKRDIGGKLNYVILASPDIDRDVFRNQLANIGRLRRPITVLTARNDSALSLASWLDGENERVGLVSADDVTVLQNAKKHNVLLVDTTSLSSSDPLGHSKFAQNGPLLAAIGSGLNSSTQKYQSGALTLQQTGQQLLKLPVNALKSATGAQ